MSRASQGFLLSFIIPYFVGCLDKLLVGGFGVINDRVNN